MGEFFRLNQKHHDSNWIEFNQCIENFPVLKRGQVEYMHNCIKNAYAKTVQSNQEIADKYKTLYPQYV